MVFYASKKQQKKKRFEKHGLIWLMCFKIIRIRILKGFYHALDCKSYSLFFESKLPFVDLF